METLGLILAGGAGRRFGGRDKAWLYCAGRPLACHASARLGPQVDRLVASANRHCWAWKRLGIEAIEDTPRWRGLGPLAAIATAFERFMPTRLAVVPVDAPHAPVDFVARLTSALDRGAPAAALLGAGRPQPLFALLSRAVAPAARAALTGDHPPAMRTWLDRVGVTWIEGGWPETAFANINTPGDLSAFETETRG